MNKFLVCIVILAISFSCSESPAEPELENYGIAVAPLFYLLWLKNDEAGFTEIYGVIARGWVINANDEPLTDLRLMYYGVDRSRDSLNIIWANEGHFTEQIPFLSWEFDKSRSDTLYPDVLYYFVANSDSLSIHKYMPSDLTLFIEVYSGETIVSSMSENFNIRNISE